MTSAAASGVRSPSPRKNAREVARLAYTRAEAAASLGVSVDFFEQHVQPHLRLVYAGQLRLVPVRELERWLEASAVRAGVGER